MGIENFLNAAGGVAETVAAGATGPAGVVAAITAAALRAGAAFAKAGKDPVIEVKRVLSAVPDVKKVEDDWNAAVLAKFPPKSDLPPDTKPTGR